MGFLEHIRNRLIRRQYSRITRQLITTTPEKLVAAGQRRLLETFHRAARTVPAYMEILRLNGVDPKEITTIEQFRKKVPVVDKETIFATNELRDLCMGGCLDNISLFYSSSGHSGVFSFGVEARTDSKKAALGLEFALNNDFNVLDRNTLLINCLPMGIKLHTRTLPLVQTGLRPDVIWALIKKLKDDFDQFVFIGEHLFLKKIFEDGAEQGIPWKDLVVHVVTGAEYIAENFRSYLASLLGVDFDSPETGMIGINFGLSELAISIFSENCHTLRIRRQAYADRDFRKALYGRDTTICPNIMQYHPSRTFIETIIAPDGSNELVVTILDPTFTIPMIRYNTKDVVEIMSYTDLAEILKDFGYESLLPPFHLPVGIIWGKMKPLITKSGQKIYTENIKEAIYSDFSIANMITGNFRLTEETDGPTLLLQLRKGKKCRESLADDLVKHLKDYVDSDVRVCVLPFEQFPYGLDHDFERKNQYV